VWHFYLLETLLPCQEIISPLKCPVNSVLPATAYDNTVSAGVAPHPEPFFAVMVPFAKVKKTTYLMQVAMTQSLAVFHPKLITTAFGPCP
jgi:hypothetical protein